MINQASFETILAAHIRSIAGKPPNKATLMEYWTALSAVVVEQLADRWYATARQYEEGRMQHYFSVEYLVGRSLLNNLINLDLYDFAVDAMSEYGISLTEVLEQETDAALGNGGLGRLAACFLDACATQKLPVKGYGILYRYGLFRQQFENGFQQEHPDIWMEEGYPFAIRHEEDAVRVCFSDFDVMAYPYDMPITGYRVSNVNTLRFWRSQSVREFDYELFNSQRFMDALIERNRADDISRVLYPNDTTDEGKLLRIRQQYFFVSASLQDMLKIFIRKHGTDFMRFPEYNCIQLNDTHPVLAVPELMRLLMDDYHLSWESAWTIVQETFAFTNHTTLPEALEVWDVHLIERIIPRIMEIIREIDRRFRLDERSQELDQAVLQSITPIGNWKVRMASIACLSSFSINGVAALHSEIIKRDTLNGWYRLFPERFNNKTNGVTPRRWLRLCNPLLSRLLTDLSGSEEWVLNLDRLESLHHLSDDPAVMEKWRMIKYQNKKNYVDTIFETTGLVISPDAVFDVQIKRIHEYKRQLMFALAILDHYFDLIDNPDLDIPDQVFVIGGKAAPGYRMAKGIIKLLNEMARLINHDRQINNRLKIIYIENYNVTEAERVIPASDVSEQISTAGKEASGTGNMKFMMNGAVTLGTYDGANIEIVSAVGSEHAYIFGAREDAFAEIRKNYQPVDLYTHQPRLRRVLDALTDGTLDDQGSGLFAEIKQSLLSGIGGSQPDPYYVLGDFEDYRQTRLRMLKDYQDQNTWAQKTWKNICASGLFSADRTIGEYAKEIWRIQAVDLSDDKT